MRYQAFEVSKQSRILGPCVSQQGLELVPNLAGGASDGSQDKTSINKSLVYQRSDPIVEASDAQ